VTKPKRLLLRAVADRAAAVASACMAAMLGPNGGRAIVLTMSTGLAGERVTPEDRVEAAADAVQAHVVPDGEAGSGERRQARVEAARRLAL
jgi:hypothetical protein